MSSPTPDPLTEGLLRLLATQSGAALLPLFTLEGQQAVIVAALAAHAQQIELLEVQMATTDEQIALIKGNLDNVRGDVTRLTAEIERVQSELDQVDPALAAKLQPLVDQSRAIADATPEPTPEPEPTP